MRNCKTNNLIGGCYDTAFGGRNKGKLKLTVGGLSNKFKRMAQLYKQFAEGWTGLDFSDEALVAMYNQESYGEPVDTRKNGYYIGKQWMGVTVSMWKEEQQRGCFSVLEIYQDPRLPWWWLDMIFVGYRQSLIDDGYTFLKDKP